MSAAIDVLQVRTVAEIERRDRIVENGSRTAASRIAGINELHDDLHGSVTPAIRGTSQAVMIETIDRSIRLSRLGDYLLT